MTVPWTLAAAQMWLRDVQEAARAVGWCVALLGSTVVDGEGRDLDAVAFPMASDAWEDWPEGWAREHRVWEDRVTKTGVRILVIEDEFGRLIDFCFLPQREVDSDQPVS